MSERSSVLLSALLGTALLVAAVVLGTFALIAGSVAGHISALVGAVSSCVVSLAQTRTFPLAILVPTVLLLASAVGLGRALILYRRERRLLKALPLHRCADVELADVARATGIDLFETPARSPAAFCFGALRPRIVFTAGLLERLSSEERAAAFWHEAQHARAREPLRCLLARLATSTFFWLPVLRDLFERYSLVRELDADRLATAHTSRGALARALHEVLVSPTPGGSVGFADRATARVHRLLDPQAPLPSLFRRSRVALSVGALAILGLAFTFPTNVPVSRQVHRETMMMQVRVMTPSGHTKTVLVPCP